MVVYGADNIARKESLMQTFLPYPDFNKSAKCLDMRRLGKQRVECLQILKCLEIGRNQCKICRKGWDFCECPYEQRRVDKNFISTPWYNHPAVRMWKGYEASLAFYGLCIGSEWIRRGYKDTCYTKILEFVKEGNHPKWLGDKKFHLAHQSNLIRKKPEYYRPIFGNDVPNDMPYYWPV